MKDFHPCFSQWQWQWQIFIPFLLSKDSNVHSTTGDVTMTMKTEYTKVPTKCKVYRVPAFSLPTSIKIIIGNNFTLQLFRILILMSFQPKDSNPSVVC